MVALDVLRAPYVGVTGVTTRGEALAVVDAWTEAWAGRTPSHLLMIGVLASWKTRWGRAVRFAARYPRWAEIAGVFVDAPGVLNLVHYAGGFGPGDTVLAQQEDLAAALAAGGPHCHGIQINGGWPHATVSGFPDRRVVFQTKSLAHSVYDGPRMATDLLLDLSGGKGAPADLAVATSAIRHSPWSRGIGLAGGFCAEHLPPAWLFDERRARGGLSVDAEGRLRDDTDGGGNLDLGKTRAYLRAAVHAIAGAVTAYTFACGCAVVLGAPSGFAADVVRVERFVTYCLPHVFSARLWGRRRPPARRKLMRAVPPGYSSVLFHASTGEPVTHAEQNERGEGVRVEGLRQRKLAHLQHLAAEGRLALRGWERVGEDQWTAPLALREARAERWGQDLGKYVAIPFGYAVNVQAQEDRLALAATSADALLRDVEEARRLARSEADWESKRRTIEALALPERVRAVGVMCNVHVDAFDSDSWWVRVHERAFAKATPALQALAKAAS